MKLIFSVITVLLLLFNGCTVRHYRVVNNQLHIYMKDKEAENVYIMTSLDEYTPRRAVAAGSGVWEVVMPPDREFRYFFLVDEKVFIPACAMKEKDDFGSENCVYTPLLGMQ